MDSAKVVIDWWPVFLSFLGLIAWLVRLEGRVKQAERDNSGTEKKVDILATKHDELDSKVVEQLASVRESLARIEGALGVGKHTA